MSCKAKLRPDINERGKPSVEFVFEGKPRYFCYGYIDQSTEELIEECRECPENVYRADEVMRDLKAGRKPIYDGLRNRTSKNFWEEWWIMKTADEMFKELGYHQTFYNYYEHDFGTTIHFQDSYTEIKFKEL